MVANLFSSPSKRREEYLATESLLISFALEGCDDGDLRPKIKPFDTWIPSAQDSPYCQIDGKCSHYRIHGISIQSEQSNGTRKESTPIILLHGYGTDCRVG